jgi:hypothetical protein
MSQIRFKPKEDKSPDKRQFTHEELNYIYSRVDLPPYAISYGLKLFWAEWRDKELDRKNNSNKWVPI